MAADDIDWSDPKNQYLGSFPTMTEINGSQFVVQVHMAMSNGRMMCVGIDVRAFAEDRSTPRRSIQSELPNGEWVSIGSPVLRGLRVAEAITAAQEPLRQTFREVIDLLSEVHGPPKTGTPEEVLERFLGHEPSRRGPKPQLSDEVLREVVAATYQMAVARPVQAVRAALEQSGSLRAPVTIDQARKAVAAARSRGFIPPVTRGRQQQEEQS